MHLYGVLGDKEPLCDIATPISFGDLAENVQLTARELFIAEMLGELRSDFRQNLLLAVVDLSNRLEHSLGRHALQQIPTSSGFQIPLNLDIVLERR